MRYAEQFEKKVYVLKIFAFSLLGFIFSIASGAAQTKNKLPGARAYYLDSAGDDKNTGTKNAPWKSIQKVNSITLRSGDTVLFKSGQVFNGTLRISENSKGIAGKRLLITSYGKGKAVINGENASAVIIEKTKFLTVHNLMLTGSGRKDGNSGDGVSITNCSNITIDHLDISGFRNSGVNVYTSSFIQVTNVRAHDNGFAGISISGEYQKKNSCNNVYIGHCIAENNPGSPVVLNNHSGNGIVAGFCSKLNIEYCIATNNGWDMPRIGNGPVGIWCYEADSVIIQHCISYRNKTSLGGDDGGGFDLDGGVTNSTIQYCLSYENQGSGFGIFQYAGASPWHGNIIRYNISENDGEVSAAHAGIYIWNSSDDAAQFYDCLFYNNTIYNAKGSAISFAGQSERKGFSFYNNIFISGDTLLKGKRANDIFLANNWWNLKTRFYIEGFTDLTEWAKKSNQEMMNGKLLGLNNDPGFSKPDSTTIHSLKQLKSFNSYRAPANSPLRNKGLDLQSVLKIRMPAIDFNGRTAPAKGIGACF